MDDEKATPITWRAVAELEAYILIWEGIENTAIIQSKENAPTVDQNDVKSQIEEIYTNADVDMELKNNPKVPMKKPQDIRNSPSMGEKVNSFKPLYFLTNLYGGGKRKKADSDSDFSPMTNNKRKLETSIISNCSTEEGVSFETLKCKSASRGSGTFGT